MIPASAPRARQSGSVAIRSRWTKIVRPACSRIGGVLGCPCDGYSPIRSPHIKLDAAARASGSGSPFSKVFLSRAAFKTGQGWPISKRRLPRFLLLTRHLIARLP